MLRVTRIPYGIHKRARRHKHARLAHISHRLSATASTYGTVSAVRQQFGGVHPACPDVSFSLRSRRLLRRLVLRSLGGVARRLSGAGSNAEGSAQPAKAGEECRLDLTRRPGIGSWPVPEAQSVPLRDEHFCQPDGSSSMTDLVLLIIAHFRECLSGSRVQEERVVPEIPRPTSNSEDQAAARTLNRCFPPMGIRDGHYASECGSAPRSPHVAQECQERPAVVLVCRSRPGKSGRAHPGSSREGIYFKPCVVSKRYEPAAPGGAAGLLESVLLKGLAVLLRSAYVGELAQIQ